MAFLKNFVWQQSLFLFSKHLDTMSNLTHLVNSKTDPWSLSSDIIFFASASYLTLEWQMKVGQGPGRETQLILRQKWPQAKLHPFWKKRQTLVHKGQIVVPKSSRFSVRCVKTNLTWSIIKRYSLIFEIILKFSIII